MVDALLFAILAFGMGGRAMLSRYNGPISRSLTLLFLLGSDVISGSGANLSTLSVPSGFFSPASMALSLFKAAMRALRRRWTMKKVMMRAVIMIATAIPIPRPACAPAPKLRLRMFVGKGAADTLAMKPQRSGSEPALNLNVFGIGVVECIKRE